MDIHELSGEQLTKHAAVAGSLAMDAMFAYMEKNGLDDDNRVAAGVATIAVLLFAEAIREANRQTLGRERAMEVELKALDVVAAHKEMKAAQREEDK